MDLIMHNYNENYINIKLSQNTAYVYSVRKLLQKAIDKKICLFKGVLVDLGCGEMPYKEYILDRNKKITKYIGIDIDNNQYHKTVKPDMFWNGRSIDLENEKVETVIATELFEHVENLDEILKESFRILKKDGVIFFTVPFIWPLHEIPFDQYRYTPYSLERVLSQSGFKDIVIIPMGGYNASLAQMICIWINNREHESMSKLKRKMFDIFEKFILYPLINKLLRDDDAFNNNYYGENTISPGFYGYAKK
jgi:SAM-dependent methyltransferase